MDPKRKGGLETERRDGWEKEREGLESRRNPHARLRVGEAIPLPQDTTMGCLFVSCLYSTVELGIEGLS